MSKTKQFFNFLALNFIISLLIYSFFITRSLTQLKELIFLIPVLFSTLFLFYLFLGSLSFFLSKIKKIGYGLIIFVFSLFHIFSIIDLILLNMYGFHINSMVINLIFTPGGLETLDQNAYMILLYVFSIIFIFFMVYLVYRLSKKMRIAIPLSKIIIFLSICLVMEKGMSAYAVSWDVVWITKNFKTFPLYQHLQMRSFLEKYFGVKPEKNNIKFIDDRNSTIRYPINNISIEKPDKLNVVFIVVDSLRFDMLTPDIMPETYRFAKENNAFILNNHYSGGNATRFGIFSIFYGIYGNYWQRFLGERKSPVLIDTLLKLDYNFGIFAASRVTYPEFDRTCFVKIDPMDIYDKPEGDKVEKDRRITEKNIEFLNKNSDKNFFSFIFFDALHGSYDYPKDMEKFAGAEKEVNHIFLRPDNIKPVFTRYKNCAYFEDSLVGKLLDTIKKKGLLKNTIVIITGDHGEPFFERGYYGHNQNFSDYEVKSPLVIYIPKKKGYIINEQTSHMDLVPTILKTIGVRNPESDFSNGINIFDAEKLKKREFVPVFSWDTAAIITKNNTVVFPIESYNLYDIKVYDNDFKQINKKPSEFQSLFKEFMKNSSLFFKK